MVRVGFAGLLFVVQAACAWALPRSESDAIVAAISLALLVSSILAFGSPDLVLRLSHGRSEVIGQTMTGMIAIGVPVSIAAWILQPGMTATAISAAVFLGIVRMLETEQRGDGRNRIAVMLFYGAQIAVFSLLGLAAWTGVAPGWSLIPLALLLASQGLGRRLARTPTHLRRQLYAGWFYLGTRRVLTIARNTVDVLLVAALAGPGVATTYALIQRLALVYQLSTFGFVYDSVTAFRCARDDGTLPEKVKEYQKMNRLTVLAVTAVVATALITVRSLHLAGDSLLLAILVFAIGQAYQASAGPISNVLLVLNHDRSLVAISGATVLLQMIGITAVAKTGLVGVAAASAGALAIARTATIVVARRAIASL